jgi:hypothetical protein
MADVRAHPPVAGESIQFVVLSLERIGDAAASGSDMVVVPHDGEPRLAMRPGHARVVEVDGRAEVRVRCVDGEWTAEIFGTSLTTLRQPLVPGGPSVTAEELAAWSEEHERWRLAAAAALYQRELAVREHALAVPLQAAALQAVTSAGREAGARADAIVSRARRNELRVSTGSELHAGQGHRMREMVTVEMVLPKGRAMRLKLRADDAVFPEFTKAARSALPQLVGEQLAQRLPPRALQAVIAGMGIAYREGGIDLEDGKVPVKFRTEVMRTMGMPSARASKAQRELVADALDGVLVSVEFHVRPQRKRAEYIPLLLASAYRDAPGSAVRQATRLVVNEELMGDMRGGKRMLVPEPVLQIGEGDRDGMLALLALQLAFRLGMGTRGHERLDGMLTRAGLWDWCQRAAAKRGVSHVMRELREGLDTLRALPWVDHPPADVVGGTMIEGDTLKSALVVYSEPPAWVRSSP